MSFLADKRRARIFYKYLSRIYDWVNPLVWTEAMREQAISTLDVEPGDRVLDVGCGTGFGTVGLLARTENVHGIDQSAYQLRKAQDKLGSFGPVSFYLGDAERLPFRDATFDVVWSSGSIEYWPRPVETLREFRRVLSSGGELLVVGPASPENRVAQRIAEAIMLFYGQADAERMFAEAGFPDPDHWLLRAHRWSPRAIVTRAVSPD